MNTEKAIDALNKLVEINNDRIEGYQTASKETKNSELKNTFSKFIQTSEKCKAELVNEVIKLGGKPIEGTKTTGKFFRAWMDVKAALTNNDDKKIFESCEYGEDVAVGTYEKVLKDDNIKDISTDQKTLLDAQYKSIKADHDKVKSKRDSLVEHSK